MTSLTHPALTDCHLSPRPAHRLPIKLLSRAAATLRLWHERIHQKRLLAQLNERDWHDMGVSRSDVDAELRRPFWRAPPRADAPARTPRRPQSAPTQSPRSTGP